MADHSKTGLFVRFSDGKKQNGGQNHLKTGFKNCSKNDHSNTRQSGIRWFTVHVFSKKGGTKGID
jgi:hypothetical protein